MRELIIFAGGLGSRLKGTEPMPKPLVPINKRAILSIIIKEYEKTGIFCRYNILISDHQELYDEWKKSEMKGIEINIINEGERTGRTGALHSFLKKVGTQNKDKRYALANGDTVIQSINKMDLMKCFEYNEKEDIPSILVMKANEERKDARDIKIGDVSYSNSGFVVTSKAWIEKICNQDKDIDIDIHIFEKGRFKAVATEAKMIDIGTPSRLRDYRKSSQ